MAREWNVYRGERLRAVAMPLGGIGTGSIALAGDGSLRQWQIHNQVNHLACVPHSFFAVWSRTFRPPDAPVARILQSSALYDSDGPPAPPTSNDHVAPLPHRRLLSRLPGVAGTEFVGEYPVAEVRYLDDALPPRVTLEALNPFVPLDHAMSAIPALLFTFTVTNPTERVLLGSLLGSLQNTAGWDGVEPIFDTRCQRYGGNSNALARLGNATAIMMGTTRLADDDPGWGTSALGVIGEADLSWQTQWDDLNGLWAGYADDGRLGDRSDTTPSAAGRTWNGALAASFRLEPGEARAIRFIVAWHYPNRYVNFEQFDFGDHKSRFWLGNEYTTRYRSAVEVVESVASDWDRLVGLTRQAREALHDTTLPPALMASVTGPMSIARTPSIFRAEDGRLYGFEGCHGASTSHQEAHGGCCPLNCTHVWNYEMALARLYPALERDMRETEWDIQQHPSGYLPHRVIVPLYLPRAWGVGNRGPDKPALDGLLGAILKTYREYLACGERAWMDRAWPAVQRALEHIWSEHDPARKGVIEGEQPNTYDISIWGANTFIGTLYLAALRAVEELARERGEAGLAAECRAVFERGRAAHESRLWNGEFYIQEVDLDAHPEQNWGPGCHTDQLFGQWWAYILGLGHLLDPEHLRAAARAIYRHNFRENFLGFTQEPRAFVADDDQGVLLSTWPNGGRPATPTQYSDEVWSGMEYELAALLLHQGDVEPALRVLEAVRARYDGRKQNPWNDIECGDHYVRAMSSWALLEIACGYRYDARTDDMHFAPRLTPEDFRAPFVARDGWGRFRQSIRDGRLTAEIALDWGELTLRTLRISGVGEVTRVLLDGEPIEVQTTTSVHGVAVVFPVPKTLRPGDVLTVHALASTITRQSPGIEVA